MRKFVNEVDIAESVLVLIDPDMIITKVFNYQLPAVGEQYQVRKGHPVSQKYGMFILKISTNQKSEKVRYSMTRQNGQISTNQTS